MKFTSFASVAALVLPTLVQAQLSGTVGPTTTTASKRTKVRDLTEYALYLDFEELLKSSVLPS